MSLSVASHQSRPVDGKDYRKVLDTDVMQHLVIGSLQKRRIHREDRPHSSRRQACRESHRMLLRDSHVKETVRIVQAEPLQAGTIRHGRRDRHHFFIALAQLYHAGGEDILIVCLFPAVFRQPCLDIERLRAVESGGMPFRRLVTFAFLGKYMYQDRAFYTFRFFQYVQELADVMSVHGSQIGNAHILKKHPGDEQLLNPALGLLQLVRQMISVRDPVQGLFYPALEIRVYFIGTQPV